MQRRGHARLAEPGAKPACPGQAPREPLEAGAVVRLDLVDQSRRAGLQDDDRVELLDDEAPGLPERAGGLDHRLEGRDRVLQLERLRDRPHLRAGEAAFDERLQHAELRAEAVEDRRPGDPRLLRERLHGRGVEFALPDQALGGVENAIDALRAGPPSCVGARCHGAGQHSRRI